MGKKKGRRKKKGGAFRAICASRSKSVSGLSRNSSQALESSAINGFKSEEKTTGLMGIKSNKAVAYNQKVDEFSDTEQTPKDFVELVKALKQLETTSKRHEALKVLKPIY